MGSDRQPSSGDDGDFEGQIEAAWAHYRRALADRLSSLDTGSVVVCQLHLPAPMAPLVTVLGVGGGLALSTPTDEHLVAVERRGDAGEALLTELGLVRAATGDWRRTLDQRQADEAAVVVVRLLRELRGVVHPALLASPTSAEPAVGLPVWQEVIDRERASDEIRAVLARAFGRRARVTGGRLGDLRLHASDGVVTAALSEDCSTLLVRAVLVLEVQDLDRALVEVNLHNLRETGLTFVLVERQICVQAQVAVMSTADGQLIDPVDRVVRGLSDWPTDLIQRVGGRVQLDEGPPASPSGVPPGKLVDHRIPELAEGTQVMRELEEDTRGSLSAQVLAGIFGRSPALLVDAISEQGDLARTWTERARTAERNRSAPHVVAAARERARYHRDLRQRLRSALRICVGAAEIIDPQPALFDADECEGGGSP